MKKINVLLLLGIFAITIKVNAQAPAPEATLNYDVLKKKKEKSDEHIQHERKKQKDKTWIKRGDLFLDIYDVNIQYLRPQMDASEIKLLYREPNEIKTITENGSQKEIWVYDRVELTIENGKLTDWKKTEKIVDNPLELAYKAYNKALELDEKDRVPRKIEDNVKEMKTKFEAEAIRAFNHENFEKSYKYFDYVVKTSKMPVFEEQVIDTASMYNAALAASNAGKYDDAIEYFKKAKKYEYGGPNLYLLMKKTYVNMEDSASALNILQKAFEKYPDNSNIIVELINYYLSSGDSEAALNYIDIAKKEDPDNKSFYFAEGTLYDKMEKRDKAIEAYQKAIELDPEYFNAYYNLGVLHYNKAVSIFDKAAEEPDNEKYEELRKAGMEQLEKSLPYMEKAHEIDPTELTTMETLKTLYYRLKKEDLHEEMLKKIEKAKAAQ